VTAPTSAYPRSVDQLLPAARQLAAELGEIPSRNRLMAELRIGAPKAGELRDALSLPSPPPSVDSDPPLKTNPAPPQTAPSPDTKPQTTVDGHPDPKIPNPSIPNPKIFNRHAVPGDTDPQADTKPANGKGVRKPVTWPVLLLCLPAFVAVWSGWVELGELSGFGLVNLLPGIVEDGGWATLNTAITLPIGVETYAAYALWVWLAARAPRARTFARNSAIGSLTFGAAGQVAYHLLAAAGKTSAPWQITSLVACLPVAVLGMGAALAHLQHANDEAD